MKGTGRVQGPVDKAGRFDLAPGDKAAQHAGRGQRLPQTGLKRDHFFHRESANLLTLLDETARTSGVSRSQAFEDFLQMTVSALSGGRIEEGYLAVVQKYTAGPHGQRGCDKLAQLFGQLVSSMEETREEIRDVLGDLFQGGITHGENAQYLTPEPLARLMAELALSAADDEPSPRRTVCDPCCGSGRLLLAVAEIQRHWTFVGQDIDLRCVRMTAINLALRNLYGYVVWGNTLTIEQKLVYRTGFDGIGVVREVELQACPAPVQQLATTVSEDDGETRVRETPGTSQLRLF